MRVDILPEVVFWKNDSGRLSIRAITADWTLVETRIFAYESMADLIVPNVARATTTDRYSASANANHAPASVGFGI